MLEDRETKGIIGVPLLLGCLRILMRPLRRCPVLRICYVRSTYFPCDMYIERVGEFQSYSSQAHL